MSSSHEDLHSPKDVYFQNARMYQLLKLAECDLQNRQLIEQALADRSARIPPLFRQYFYDYMYADNHHDLRQVNYMAQIAFLLYFFADIFIIPDIFFLSGVSRVLLVIVAMLCGSYLFNHYKNIQVLEMFLPVCTTVAAGIWIGLLLLSNSPHVSTYLYATAIFILVTNLCIKTQFKGALYCSIFIALFMTIGAIDLLTWSQGLIFAVVSIPLWCFSIYINWNNTLNVRRIFLRNLLDEWNYQTLKNLAHTDDLTKLYNRRHFVNLAEQAIQKWPKHAGTCLLMFDVDHFKLINDNYGHDVGDQVLQLIAEVTRKEMRQTDVLARFGGEEFIALLEYTQPYDSLMIAERIRKIIQKQVFYITPDQSIQFTISIGIAELESPEQTLDDLIKKADLALYQAKKAGRNRIKIYHPDILKPATSSFAKHRNIVQAVQQAAKNSDKQAQSSSPL